MIIDRDDSPNQVEIESQTLKTFREGALSKLGDFTEALNKLDTKNRSKFLKKFDLVLENHAIPTAKRFIEHMGYDKEAGSSSEPRTVEIAIKRIEGFESKLENEATTSLLRKNFKRAEEIIQYSLPVVGAFIRSMGADKFMGRDETGVDIFEMIEYMGSDPIKKDSI